MATIFSFEAIGTKWQIDIKDDLTPDRESLLELQIKEKIFHFEQRYSRFLPDSLVGQMSRQSGTYVLNDEDERLLLAYHEMYEATDGLVTPLIGGMLSDIGYDASYTFQPQDLISPAPSWAETFSFEPGKMTLLKPAPFDFGAGGKGYLIDLVGEICHQHNLKSFLIEAGGDMLHYDIDGSSVVGVGLEHPLDETMAVGIARLGSASLCGSSGSRRRFGRFHHIINPKSVASPQAILAVWVMADNTILADLLTTALMFVDKETLRPRFNFSCAFMTADNKLYADDFFPAEFFVN